MTMQFQVVRDALVQLLKDEADQGPGARYQVIDHQPHGIGAGERENLPTVTVFYRNGTFPKSGGSIAGPNSHEPVYELQFMLLQASEGDLSALQSAADDAARAAAIITFNIAAQVADRKMDQLMDDIYQVIMDADKEFLGLAIGDLAERWVGSMRKDDPVPGGESVLLSGAMQFGCKVSEEVLGITGAAGVDHDTTVDIDGDDVEKTGQSGQLGGA